MDTNDGRNIRLLLVDDEIDFLTAVAPPLARRGFSLTLAEDGASALDLLSRQSFDVVVSDVKMPGVGGVDLFYRIKRESPHLPVILLTGHATVGDAFQTSRDGVFEYLTKPCTVDRLAEVVQAAASDARQRRAATAATPSSPPAGVRLLLGDWDEELLDALGSALSRRGLEVVTVQSGAAALEQAKNGSFHVAVVDMAIAGALGSGLVRSLKEARPGMEVLVVTGQPSSEDAVESLRAGAHAFLVKPQPLEAMLDHIWDAIESNDLRRQAEHQRLVERVLEDKPD